MKLVQKHSPNFNHRPAPIDTIVLHATADSDTMASVDWCCDPKSKVSYHVIVDRDGTVYSLVPIDMRSWHAGVSRFDGRDNVNDVSIGLSFGNRNDGHEAYTDQQYAIGAALCASWMRLHPAITLDRITTHAAIALPPGRKTDPLAFDMDRFKALVATELGV